MGRHITSYDDSIINDIHPTLKDQLDLEINKQLLDKVDRFRSLPEAILLMLIHSLESRIFLPDEIVFLIGESAKELFFIARGDLKMLDFQGKTIKYFSDGDYFGEDFVQVNARRKSTVSSLGHSELLVLDKIKMNMVSHRYPEFALLLHKWSHEEMWQSLRHWERIQYAIETQKNIKSQMGIDNLSFSQTYQHLNSFDSQHSSENITPRMSLCKTKKSGKKMRSCSNVTTTLAKARMSVLGDNRWVSYDAFNTAYSNWYQETTDAEVEKELKSRSRERFMRRSMTACNMSTNKGMESLLEIVTE